MGEQRRKKQSILAQISQFEELSEAGLLTHDDLEEWKDYDTLLFLQADSHMVASLKLHLIAFENLSGMKINYAKSEMVPLNLLVQEGHHLAQIFGCTVSCLPITYLGLPLHYKKPKLIDWQSVIDKIESRLQGYKGKLLSYGGRLTLLNSVLSAIPIYWLSVFVMPTKIRMRIEQLRRRFLWFGGSTVRKKYYLVSWDTMCKSKNQGG
ncbi:uncharacterized protein LOC144565020 [Carex rostrata]